MKILEGPVSPIASLASDECRILAGCEDGSLIEWNFDSLSRPQEVSGWLAKDQLKNQVVTWTKRAVNCLSPKGWGLVLIVITTAVAYKYAKNKRFL